jgi:CBS domain-containing protein
MKAKDIMSRHVWTCTPESNLQEACQVMWEHDCGSVPVVDADGRGLHGIVTDRDACMAVYTQGRGLGEIPVTVAMTGEVQHCLPDDDLATVHEIMRRHRIRRVPVLDGDQLVGIVSLNDMALAAQNGRPVANESPSAVGSTLAEICRHRAASEPVEAEAMAADAPDRARARAGA